MARLGLLGKLLPIVVLSLLALMVCVPLSLLLLPILLILLSIIMLGCEVVRRRNLRNLKFEIFSVCVLSESGHELPGLTEEVIKLLSVHRAPCCTSRCTVLDAATANCFYEASVAQGLKAMELGLDIYIRPIIDPSHDGRIRVIGKVGQEIQGSTARQIIEFCLLGCKGHFLRHLPSSEFRCKGPDRFNLRELQTALAAIRSNPIHAWFA